MKPDPSQAGDAGEHGHPDGQRGHEITPSSDVQGDDAGTPDSGNADSATAAQAAPKAAGHTPGNKNSDR